MFNPIQSNTQSTMIPVDAFPGQKTERFQENPRPVVDRKQEIPSAREEIPREEVERAAEKLKRLMSSAGRPIKTKIREKSGRIRIRIIDQKGEVLEEITPQEVFDRLTFLAQAGGRFFDKRV